MNAAPTGHSVDDFQTTPLHEEHVALGAKMVPFAGYRMPVQYPAGIVAEHRAVRESAGLFDVSHMGELEIAGPQALDWIQRVTTNDASRLEVGQAQYTVLCTGMGGIVDDCLLYRFDDRYMLVVNASNVERDRQWILENREGLDAMLDDRSQATALLALQGPRAEEILAPLADRDPGGIGYYRFAEGAVAGHAAVISRTGYTGEDGFELYVGAESAVPIWRRLLQTGGARGLLPAGLGARDSLRLEMGYALYGNDLDDSRTPLEAGLGWVVKLDKGDFVGRDALARQKERGVEVRLAGFVLAERGFPRHGYELRRGGERIGEVTSGVHSPSLEKGIGMGYVPSGAAKPGTEIQVAIRGRDVPAEVVRPPFYRSGSLRR